MQAIINKIYDGHILYDYRALLISEIPNLDEYRSYKTGTGSSLAKHVDDIPEIVIYL